MFDLLGRKNPDIRGQETVEPPADGFLIQTGVAVKMGHHGLGMHAGVGATGSVQNNLFLDKHGQPLLDGSLDGGHLGLPLPTVVVGTIKADHQPDVTLHQGNSGVAIRAVSSGKPHIRFMFWTA